MTRDFKNQRREDRRPDSRGSSSRRFGEERPSRPARPRLNRDMVDRAWENGARQNHADYRTRSESNSHPPRDNRRPNQHSNRYSAQNSSNGRKPYGNRKDDYRPGNHGNSQHPNSRSQYQSRDQYKGTQRREFDRDTRSSRSFDRDQRQARDYDRDGRQPRSYDRDKRSSRNASGPDTHNPRWQSRPERQHNNYPNKPREYTRYVAEQELFEGDYEQFDKSDSAQPHTASASTRERKTTKAKTRQSRPKPRSTGPKPSQRGYKWPTPEA